MTYPVLAPIHSEKLSQLFQEAFSSALSNLDDSKVLMELEEWDSLSHMQFITELETEFGFELTGDEIADMQSVGDVKKVVASKTREGS